MKNTIKRVKSLLFAATLALLCCLPLIACQNGGQTGEQQVKSEYTVTFVFGYEGAQNVVKTVQAGRRVTAPVPDSRTGYAFGGWYEDGSFAASSTPFDFTTVIEKDYTLYAKWDAQAVKHVVTFNMDHAGIADKTAEVASGATIPAASVPQSERLGYVVTGWCTDKTDAAGTAFDVSTGTVNSDMTLYAVYGRDPSVPLNEDGSIKYEDVEIQIATLFYDPAINTMIANAAARFNLESELNGKHITVSVLADKIYFEKDWEEVGPNVTATLYSTAYPFALNQDASRPYVTHSENFYSAADVYDFAGLEFNADNYFTDAVRDCYCDGRLFSVPVMTSVPVLAYNKAMMQTYNEGKLPSSYSEFAALLKKIYAEESKTNDEFASAEISLGWPFYECASYAPFIQNDSEYTKLINGQIVNDWELSLDGANKPVTALNNMIDLFGVKGSCGGKSANNLNVYNDVASGKAFCGLVTSFYDGKRIMENSSAVGVLPLSGLFSDDGVNRMQIPVYNYGVQFYKNTNASLVQIAAAAEFADWLSKNYARYASGTYLYPLEKNAAQKFDTDYAQNNDGKFFKLAGNSNNFRTLDGFIYSKTVFNTFAGEGVVGSSLSDLQYDPEYDGLARIFDLRKRIQNRLKKEA